MDFSIFSQLNTKRFWWMDVLFYFAISLLIATVFCYVVFLIKNNIQRQEIEKTIVALESVGTSQQKEFEETVLSYQKKISDFKKIFANHEFASHVFTFMQDQTMPNVWFRRFGLERKNNRVQLFGEADDMEAFSRQVAYFENNEYINDVGTLNSTVGELARTQFNLQLDIDSKIFSYVPEPIETEEETEDEESAEDDKEETEEDDSKEGDIDEDTEQESVTEDEEEIVDEELIEAKDTEKEITIFNLLLTPEVTGIIDQETHTIALDVPFGTDLTSIRPLIIYSYTAKMSPSSGVLQDFTNPVIYTVTAEDGSTQDYTAVVNVLPEVKQEVIEPEKKSILPIIIFALIFVAIILSIILFVWYKFKIKNKVF